KKGIKFIIMKKLFQLSLFLVFVGFIASCNSANQAIRQVSRSDVSGTWQVSSVSLENFPAGTELGNVFDMYRYQDFEGSTWILQGNGFGSIRLNNGAVQPIYWSVNKAGGFHTFDFKKLADGQRPRDVTTGYTLEFGNWMDGSAQLRSPVRLSSGQTGYIVF